MKRNKDAETITINIDKQKDDVKMLIRVFQIFLHDLYAKIPIDIEQGEFETHVDKISRIIRKMFGKMANK